MKWNPLTWFRKVVPIVKEEPEARIVANPININPVDEIILKRHVGRLVNLLSSAASGDTRPELFAEIKTRQTAIFGYGHGKIETERAARDLFDKLKGAK